MARALGPHGLPRVRLPTPSRIPPARSAYLGKPALPDLVRSHSMLDIFVLALGIGGFAALCGYVLLCQKL
jgi:hypothetical protein